MQGYQHVTAAGNNGSLTLATGKPAEQFVLLGASCVTSVTVHDGLVSSLSVLPKRKNEVIALAVVASSRDSTWIGEVLLLHVSLKDGKASVNLHVPYGGAKDMLAQLIKKGESCQLRIIEDEKTKNSIPWNLASLNPKADAPQIETVTGESINDLCIALAKADNVEEIIDVQLLTAGFTPDAVVKAFPVSQIMQCGFSFQRTISVCPGQGVAYQNQVLVAEWKNSQWEVAHPCC
ncbi:MAG: hypothetical protein JWO73_141 [Candidatus Taylorbacteria bacterium]|nr:hypothetical protein [Candidatus Taylorbacteria bacterium]